MLKADTQWRKICWPFPMQECFRGECKECKHSSKEVTFDQLTDYACILFLREIPTRLLKQSMEEQ